MFSKVSREVAKKFTAISRLTPFMKSITRLEDEDRDADVGFFPDLASDSELPSGARAFDAAGRISKRVAIAVNRFRA